MESKVSKSGTVKIPFKSTPSFLHNVITSDGKSYCVVNNNGEHLCTIFQISTESLPYNKTEENFIKTEDDQEITDAKFVKIQGQSKLVITFNNGFKVYSEDGKRLLHFVKIQEKDQRFYKDGSVQHYFQGITGAVSQNGKEVICVGNSLGEIYVVENIKENTYTSSVVTTIKKNTPISYITSSASNNLLFVGDTESSISIYSLETEKSPKYLKTIELGSHNNPVTAMAVYENDAICYLFVGDMLGKIRVYDAKTYNLVIEIAAHFRSVTSLDINIKLNRFISTSEDTYLNVWKINAENGINLILMKSYNSDDKMIMGGRIVEAPKFNVMVAQYECDEISVLTALT